MTGLEVRITRGINEALGRKGRLWADRYHRHDLCTPTETKNAVRYVLLNVHKHRHVFADRPFADPMSSAPTFGGFARAAHLVDDGLRWAPVTPRTWLLARGWQRHGLIDPAGPLLPSRRGSSRGRR